MRFVHLTFNFVQLSFKQLAWHWFICTVQHSASQSVCPLWYCLCRNKCIWMWLHW